MVEDHHNEDEGLDSNQASNPEGAEVKWPCARTNQKNDRRLQQVEPSHQEPEAEPIPVPRSIFLNRCPVP